MSSSFSFAGRRIIASGVLLFLLLIGAPLEMQAQAQVRLLRALPMPGAAVSAPLLVQLWFNEPLKSGANKLLVLSTEDLAVGQQYNMARGMPIVDPKDPTHLSVMLEPLPPGEYVVEWQVSTLAGHNATGRFNFHVVGSF
ncbi:MAG: Copper resistance protein CopC [Pedosphaera sp.]|nr:Copper resistance protein CopC [Pedosphaera sp.]